MGCGNGKSNDAVLTVQSPTNQVTNRNEKVTKIQVAVVVIGTFLRKLMNVADRCSLVAFNDKYKILSLLGNEDTAINGLISCLNSCGGGTQLWKAVVMSAAQFIATADQSRPWILIVLTDGEDSGGGTSAKDVATALTLFNRPANNFTFFVGLGNNAGERELRGVCNASNSLYFGARDGEALQLIFAIVALQIVQGVQVNIAQVRAEGIEAVYARIQQVSSLRRNPVDMLILLDVSGSMDEAA